MTHDFCILRRSDYLIFKIRNLILINKIQRQVTGIHTHNSSHRIFLTTVAYNILSTITRFQDPRSFTILSTIPTPLSPSPIFRYFPIILCVLWIFVESVSTSRNSVPLYSVWSPDNFILERRSSGSLRQSNLPYKSNVRSSSRSLWNVNYEDTFPFGKRTIPSCDAPSSISYGPLARLLDLLWNTFGSLWAKFDSLLRWKRTGNYSKAI